ncbi:MnhB domain-containing protein [Halobaculum marinum]|uniref:MnhB domain-containing protein n=1 Tax=Halobaculum marinum TaxID=3031996 RepID=A0ABD5WYD3_9EURY|nr:MnhB domain-containing protein [Halobaculum sp. DT55]
MSDNADRASEAHAADSSEAVSDQASNGSNHPSYDRHTTVIARTVVRVVVPIILVTAIGLLFQGHNRPGGGFIGAVLTVTAFVLVYVIFGLDYLQDELLGIDDPNDGTHAAVEQYRWLFAGGLALAAGSGLVPVVAGLPFLTQAVLFLEGVPLYGNFELASAFAFDLGVYLAVVGGLLTVLGEVGYE